MSAAIKAAITVLMDKNLRKAVGGIILGVVVILLIPIVVVLGIADSEFEVDKEQVAQQVEANLTPEQIAQMKEVEDMFQEIETKMREKGFASRTMEAQILYLALGNQSTSGGFVDKLVSCFNLDQTDQQLIDLVNQVFGTSFSFEDFTKVMSGIRTVAIDTSGFKDPTTKNNLDLATWAEQACQTGWGYVYGTYGTVLSETILRQKLQQFPDEVVPFESFIRQNWMGKRTADCIGLIKAYGWFDPNTGEINYGTNGIQDLSANNTFEAATEKGTIDTIPEVPGIIVWEPGHVGIYLGNDTVIESMNTEKGVVKTQLSKRSFTHWFYMPGIRYQ
ncbi:MULTISPECIES: hypothetical protein [Clostridiaceae]|uniref:NlpC/P60 family protein n=1 Tax=Clostridium facile TaxID=2763035 RepID=A0ABR7IPN9_9CLOT|nr:MULTISPECIES: hypothetical protein [Clostridiaceae]MBC5787053.1 hypothetical protein [Clostridium facile]